MNVLLQKIVGECFACQKDSKTLQYNCIRLKRNLSKLDKKLFLRIIDEKDLMIEDAASNNFEKGFCIQGVFEILMINQG